MTYDNAMKILGGPDLSRSQKKGKSDDDCGCSSSAKGGVDAGYSLSPRASCLYGASSVPGLVTNFGTAIPYYNATSATGRDFLEKTLADNSANPVTIQEVGSYADSQWTLIFSHGGSTQQSFFGWIIEETDLLKVLPPLTITAYSDKYVSGSWVANQVSSFQVQFAARMLAAGQVLAKFDDFLGAYRVDAGLFNVSSTPAEGEQRFRIVVSGPANSSTISFRGYYAWEGNQVFNLARRFY